MKNKQKKSSDASKNAPKVKSTETKSKSIDVAKIVTAYDRAQPQQATNDARPADRSIDTEKQKK